MATQTMQEIKRAQLRGIFMSLIFCMTGMLVAALFLVWQVPTISHNGMIVILPVFAVGIYAIYFIKRHSQDVNFAAA